MKKINGKLAFGMNAIVSGQKSATVNADPVLVACSTKGKFTITAPVSKALGLASGDYVMFFNNFGPIEAAIAERNEDIVAFCDENGLDIESVAAHDAIIKEFGAWAIAKGVQRLDKKGMPVMVSDRWTKSDKKEYLAANFEELIAPKKAEILEAMGVEDATDEELIDAAVDSFNPMTEDYSGAKASNISGQNGIGVQLSFTDSAIWGSLKKDCDDPTKINRNYKVCLDECEVIKYNNGYQDVDVKTYPIEFTEDTTPIVRATK